MGLPDDLRIAYETFTMLATKHGYAFAGMMTGTNPPSLVVIGNVTERGHELGLLLRQYAEIIEQKTDAGQIEKAVPRNVH